MSNAFLNNVADSAIDFLDKQAKSAKYRNDPVAWAEGFLGVQLWSKQKEILYSIRDNRNTAVAAGHGVGKSFVVAVAVLWWIDVHPWDAQETFVATTAPFQDQITTILWDNMRSMFDRVKQRKRDGLVDHVLPGYITGDNKWKLDSGQIIAQGRKPPDNKADSGYQGKHATFLLAIGDEAAGLGKDMVDALGNISTGPENRMVLIANPTDPTSAMAKIWKEKMPSWNRMKISVFDSPLITGEEGFDPSRAGGMSGMEYVNEALEKYGSEDDPRYQSRVLGEWAFDAANNVFTEEDLAKAGNCVVLPDPDGTMEFGCDIARMGADSTWVYYRQFGEVWSTDPETTKPITQSGVRGSIVRKLGNWSKAPLVGSDPANLGSAERIHALALQHGAKIVKVDASGLGSGVVDGLRELCSGQYVIVEVFGGAAPADTRAYINMRAEQYFRLKKLMYAGEMDLDSQDEDLLEELRGVLFENADKGQVKIESKDSMKRRNVKSPDRADALWYACLDVDHLLNPLAQMKKGDRVSFDPDDIEMDALAFDAIGEPW